MTRNDNPHGEHHNGRGQATRREIGNAKGIDWTVRQTDDVACAPNELATSSGGVGADQPTRLGANIAASSWPPIAWLPTSRPRSRPPERPGDDLLHRQCAAWVVAQAQRRSHFLEQAAFARGVELPWLQPRDVSHVAALGFGYLLGRVNLRRSVKKADELSGGVPRNAVVQSLRGLRGEYESEAVLASLGGQSDRTLRARSRPL